MDKEVLFKFWDEFKDMRKEIDTKFSQLEDKIDVLNDKHNGLKMKVATISAAIGAFGAKVFGLFLSGR